MVHFDFIVEDHEAEMLMSLITDEIGRLNVMIVELLPQSDTDEKITWLRQHVDYLKAVKGKMHNSRCQQPEIKEK